MHANDQFTTIASKRIQYYNRGHGLLDTSAKLSRKQEPLMHARCFPYPILCVVVTLTLGLPAACIRSTADDLTAGALASGDASGESAGGTVDDAGGEDRPDNVGDEIDDGMAPDDPGSDESAGAEADPSDDDVLANLQVFPPDNPWNADISEYPVHPNSDSYIASIGLDTGLHPDFGTQWQGAPIGIPFVIVDGDQPQVSISFYYDDESDPGPYPIPPDAPIEGGPDSDGDRHILVIDRENKLLYEVFDAHPAGDGWEAGSGAIFDLTSNDLRPSGWTSADAAGLPIFPGLVRYDEVERGEIDHALRFTVAQSQRAYIEPARHWASSSTDPARPPMGLRVRLKADFDISGYTPNVQVILRAMKKYGMLVADNGSNWYVSGAPDPRWDDDELRQLRSVQGSDFEVVYTGELVTE